MFVPQNSLEEAFVQAMHDAAARPRFYWLLLAAQLFVIGEPDGASASDQTVKLAPGSPLRLAAIRRETRELIPVFTSLPRLQTYFQNTGKLGAITQYVTMSGRALFEMTKGASFLLNPGFEISKELAAAEIAEVLTLPAS